MAKREKERKGKRRWQIKENKKARKEKRKKTSKKTWFWHPLRFGYDNISCWQIMKWKSKERGGITTEKTVAHLLRRKKKPKFSMQEASNVKFEKKKREKSVGGQISTFDKKSWGWKMRKHQRHKKTKWG